MALQLMILVLSYLWEKHPQTTPTVKNVLVSKDDSYNKWTQVHLHQGPT